MREQLVLVAYNPGNDTIAPYYVDQVNAMRKRAGDTVLNRERFKTHSYLLSY